nr:hypothetical protein [Prosthecobacter dejongeii]
MPAPFVLSQRGVNKMKQVKVYEGENVAAHFEAVAALPELLENSEVLARKPDSEGKDVAFYERRYAWAVFPDGQRRHVLMTVRYLLQTAEPPRMYSLEALEVRDALEAFNDGEPSEQSAPSSAATKLSFSLTDFMAGVKSEDKAELILSDRLEALSADLGEQVQAQPEQQPALLQRAHEHLATAHATWAAQPTSTSAQQQALRSLDAVLTVLPPEVRAQLGGFLQLSSLSTAAARHTEIEKRFTQLTDYLAQPRATQAGDATARLSSFIPSGEKPVNPGNEGTKGPEGLTSQSGKVPPGEGNSRSQDYTRLPSPLFVPGQQIVEVFGGENSQIPGAINVDLRAQQGIKDSVENISRHFAPKSQDLIVASNPYGLPMEAWLIEASKVLKKGGRIVINGTKGNKFIKVPENQVLKEMGFKLVVEKTALAEDFKVHFFKTTDGRELFHKAVMTTIIEKIND